MNIEINRTDIKSAIKNVVNSALESLPVEKRLEALEWFKEIIEEIQDEQL